MNNDEMNTIDNEYINYKKQLQNKAATKFALHECYKYFRHKFYILQDENTELKSQILDLKDQFENFKNEYEFPITKEVYELQEQCMHISIELWIEVLTFYVRHSANDYKLLFISDMIKSCGRLWKFRPSERQATYALRLLAEYKEEKASIAATANEQ